MSARKNINWKDQPLGILPDVYIAENVGVATSTVRYQRRQRGIAHPTRSKKAGLPLRIYELLTNLRPWSTSQIGDALGCDPNRLRSTLHEMAERGDIKRHRDRSHSTLHWALPGVEIKNTKRFKGYTKPSTRATYREATQEWETSDPVLDPGTCRLVGFANEDRSDRFTCTRKGRAVSLQECINLFGEVHAYRKTESTCYGCAVGALHRLRHCYDIEPTDRLVGDMVKTVTKGCKVAEMRIERAMT